MRKNPGTFFDPFFRFQGHLNDDISLPRHFVDQLGSVGSLVGVGMMVRGVTIAPDFQENRPKMAHFSTIALYTVY